MNQLVLKKKNELTKNKKGFTLVELIIVIAIIAILAAIAIPKFGQITRNSNVSADIATAKNIHGVTAQLIADGEIIPGTTADDDIASAVAARLDTGDGTNLPVARTNDESFEIEVEDDGDIIISSNGANVYPTQEEPFIR